MFNMYLHVQEYIIGPDCMFYFVFSMLNYSVTQSVTLEERALREMFELYEPVF